MKHNTSFLLIAVTEFQLKNLPVQNLYTFTKLLQAIYFSKHDVNKEFWQSLVRFEDRPQLMDDEKIVRTFRKRCYTKTL